MRWFRRKRHSGVKRLPTSILEASDEGRYHVEVVMPVPELMAGAMVEIEKVLTPEFGGDYARRTADLLEAHNWAKCMGGWLPLVKAVNMIQCHACFPHNDVLVSYCIGGVSGNKIAEQRNHGVLRALENGADYIWFLDYDVINPPSGFGILKSRDMDIVSGTYFYKDHYCRTMAMVPPSHVHFDAWWRKRGVEYAPGEVFAPGKLYPGMGLVPCGNLLVKTSVFKKIPQPWFTDGNAILKGGEGVGWTDDGYFSQKAREHGFTLCLDTAVQSDHVDFQRGVVFGFDIQNNEPGWRFLTEAENVWHSFRGEVASLGYIERSQDAPEGEAGGAGRGALDECDAEPDSERSGAACGA